MARWRTCFFSIRKSPIERQNSPNPRRSAATSAPFHLCSNELHIADCNPMQSSNKQTKQIPISRPRWCSRRLLRLLLRFMVRRTLITPLRVVTAHPPRLVMSRKQRILAADNLRMVDNLLRHVRLNTVAAWGNPIIRSAVIVGLDHPRIRPTHRVHGPVKFGAAHVSHHQTHGAARRHWRPNGRQFSVPI